MSNPDRSKIVDTFIAEMLAVANLQQWLISTAGYLRMSIASGETDNRLIPMAEYLERQAASLTTFVKGLDNPPKIEGVAVEPVVNVKPVDPKMN